MAWFSGAVEGLPDQAVLQRVLSFCDHQTHLIMNCRGKHRLDQKITSYNAAARFGNWVILRDLDHDADCGPELKERLLSRTSPGMQFRIVVREIESWLMGDADAFARYFGVSRRRVPGNPEGIANPKSTVINLV